MKRLAEFVEKVVTESFKDSIEKIVECKFDKIETMDKTGIDEQIFTQIEIESTKPAGTFFMLLTKNIAELLVDDKLTNESLEDLMFQFSFDFSARYDEVTESQMGWQVTSSSIDAKLNDTVYKGDYIFMSYDIGVGSQKGKWLWIMPEQYVSEIAEKFSDNVQNDNAAKQNDSKAETGEIHTLGNSDAVNMEPAAAREISVNQNNVRNLDVLMDVNLHVVVRVGTKKMLLKEILKLVPGNKILFSQDIDDPLDVLVNGKIVAKGKVVSVDGFFGIKITSIESKYSRLNKLK
ncbi:MAG: hypothetical protein IEMM0003_0391 [bacterium]|nr:MAG: hypothetical protein IEMM0003_0391 [bacterium]